MILILSGLFPVILIGKMLELYTYAITPFYLMFIGILFYHSFYFLKDKSSIYKQYVKGTIIISFIIWLGYGTNNNVTELVYTNNRTKQYYSHISNFAKSNKENDISIFVSKKNSTDSENDYNVFYFSDLSILKSFSPLILKLSKKIICYFISESDSSACDYRVYKDAEILRV